MATRSLSQDSADHYTCRVSLADDDLPDCHDARASFKTCRGLWLGDIPLKGTRPGFALVIKKREAESKPELWVRWNYRNYRKAFRLFLFHHYRFPNLVLPRSLQVDHLYPTSGFKDAEHNYFVRLILLDRKTNASYGAGPESSFYPKERERECGKHDGIHMDWITFLKATNTRIPAKSAGEKSWSTWAWRFAGEYNAEYPSEDKVLSYHSITVMLNLVYHQRYRPIPLQPSFLDEARSSPSFACFPGLHQHE